MFDFHSCHEGRVRVACLFENTETKTGNEHFMAVGGFLALIGENARLFWPNTTKVLTNRSLVTPTRVAK